MKKLIDLAISYARKKQSKKTGFFHEEETIPLYENFLFALTLCRMKSVDNFLEAKALLERLFCFQSKDGNFPNYLHEYPLCKDQYLGLKIAPILKQIEQSFSSVINVEPVLRKIVAYYEEITLPPLWKERFLALKKAPFEKEFSPRNAQDFAEIIITYQLAGHEIPPLPFDPELNLFFEGKEVQEKGEPMPLALEWALSSSFWGRHLQDHPNLLRAVIFLPITTSFIPRKEVEARFLWKGEKLHSLSAPFGIFDGKETVSFFIESEFTPDKGEKVEAAFYVDLSPDTKVFINGQRGTIFRLGEKVEIVTPTKSFTLIFSLKEGDGEFIGQISRANRPGQTYAKDEHRYEVFDTQIGIQTLRRNGPCQLVATCKNS